MKSTTIIYKIRLHLTSMFYMTSYM